MKPLLLTVTTAGLIGAGGSVWANEIFGFDKNSLEYLAATYLFGIIAVSIFFRVITWDLWGKKRLRKKHNGRWVGAFLASLTWLNFIPKDMSINTWAAVALLTAVGYLIGFIIGYIWRHFVQPQVV